MTIMTNLNELTELTLGELADQYRDALDVIKLLEDQVKEHKRNNAVLQNIILQRMEESEIDTYKTEKITLTRKEELMPSVSSWDSVYNWIAEGSRWEFVRKQLNTGPFREMIERGETFPDGLEAVAIVKLNQRRK